MVFMLYAAGLLGRGAEWAVYGEFEGGRNFALSQVTAGGRGSPKVLTR
jgi:hypothetical protein